MEMSNQLGSDEKFHEQLESCSKLLIEKLQNNDYQEASELIHTLYEARDKHVYTAVGKLTRALHNAIVNFHVDVDVDIEGVSEGGEVNSEIRDASDRLQYVIKMTQEAADKTMDRVESSAPIAMNLRQEASDLRSEWEKLHRRELSKEEFSDLYARLGTFLDETGESTEALNNNLQAIILEQGFQDLTGQVLKKVIGLITDVEKELVNLVRIAGQVEEMTGIVVPDGENGKKDTCEAEGPQIHAQVREDVVSGQDQVDDLLSSLGF